MQDSVNMRDRTSQGSGKSRDNQGIYNDVARDHVMLVHGPTDRRHAMLCSMFPHFTPRAERIVDYLMSVTQAEFDVLCHHEGVVVRLTHEKLALIGEALDETEGDVKLPTFGDDFVDEAELDMERELARICG